MKYDLEEMLRKKDDIKPSKELDQAVLQSIEEGMNMKEKSNRFLTRTGKIAAAFLAGIITTGGIAYAASHLWNQDVAKQFGVNNKEKTMQDLNNQGFADIPTSTKKTPLEVEKEGIKVKVLQTLADEQSAFIYLQVEYGDQYKVIDKEIKTYPYTDIADSNISQPASIYFTLNGSDESLSYSYETKEIKDKNTVTYCCQLLSDGQSFKNAKINMLIRNFDVWKTDVAYPMSVAVDDWNLSWNLSTGTNKRVYTLNKKLTIKDTSVTLKSFELSPLSCKLTIDAQDYDKLQRIGAIIKSTGEHPKTDKNGNYIIVRYVDLFDNTQEPKEDEGLVPLDDLSHLYLGNKPFDGLGGGTENASGNNSPAKTIVTQSAFSKVLDVDKVTAFRYAGQLVNLKDYDYKTVNSFSNN